MHNRYRSALLGALATNMVPILVDEANVVCVSCVEIKKIHQTFQKSFFDFSLVRNPRFLIFLIRARLKFRKITRVVLTLLSRRNQSTQLHTTVNR